MQDCFNCAAGRWNHVNQKTKRASSTISPANSTTKVYNQPSSCVLRYSGIKTGLKIPIYWIVRPLVCLISELYFQQQNNTAPIYLDSKCVALLWFIRSRFKKCVGARRRGLEVNPLLSKPWFLHVYAIFLTGIYQNTFQDQKRKLFPDLVSLCTTAQERYQ